MISLLFSDDLMIRYETEK